MSGFFKGLFSSGELVENVSSGLDKAFYTEQEKAGGFASLIKLYEPFKLAQRLLAIIFCIPYMLMFFITWGVSFAGVDVSNQMQMINGDITTAVGIILAFYFGGGAFEGVIKAVKNER